MTGYAASFYLGADAAAPDGDTAEPQPPAETEQPSTDGLSAGARAAVTGTGGGGLNLRYEAGYGAGIITVVPEADIITIVDGPVFDGDGAAWFQVDFAGTIGWVHGGYLAVTDAAPTTDTTVEPAPTPEPTPEPVSEPEQPEEEEEPGAAVSGVGASIVAEALNYVGLPYVWGGTTPAGFDCSGFTFYVVNRVGIGLSRDMAVQVTSGSYVGTDQLQPGDLVFFQNTYKWGLSHVGIFIGGGQFVHAGSERTGVLVSDLWDSYWGPRYYTARRLYA
jgi:cell wall-associated NlpC family hydrolase